MKNFNEEHFKFTLRQAPWDTVFLFDDIDDILDSWESLFIGAIDTHCPWRDKRVARANQAPWMSKSVLSQLQLRDACLKTARLTNTSDAWTKYRRERNKAVGLLRSVKRDYHSKIFENNKKNSRNNWKTIKSLTGSTKGNQPVNSLNDGVNVTDDPKQMATKFNEHFSTVAERLRSTLPNIALNMDKVINFVNSKKDPDVSFVIPPITEVQMIASLLKISPLKASGIDKISVRLLRIAAPEIAPSIKLLCTRVESLMMYLITGQFQSCPYYLK